MSAGPFLFLDSVCWIRVSHDDGPDGMSVVEFDLPHGDSPPLHIHQTEDEVLHIISGSFRVHVAGKDLMGGPGDTFHTPKGTPHTYRVESPEGGRMLAITTRGDFERFVRSLSRPAPDAAKPANAGPPSPEAIALLTSAAREYGIELVGPPLSPAITG